VIEDGNLVLCDRTKDMLRIAQALFRRHSNS
jgi:hypothetical protein